MDDAVPNAYARSANGEKIEYGRVGESRLKLKWHARREKGWVEFSSADLEVSLNDVPLLLDELVIIIDPKGRLPRARFSVNLSELDIDADTLMALQAYMMQQQGG